LIIGQFVRLIILGEGSAFCETCDCQTGGPGDYDQDEQGKEPGAENRWTVLAESAPGVLAGA
jgi:hypothetical protein